jgi:hypothetical protein
MAERPATQSYPWYALEPTDFGAHPQAVPVASEYPTSSGPGTGERFWHMAPQEQKGDRPPRHYAPMPPQPRFVRRERVEGSVAGLAEGGSVAEGSVADGSVAAGSGSVAGNDAPQGERRQRHLPPTAVPEDGRWYKMEPQQLPEGYAKPPTPEPGPTTLLEEDGHWYRMKPKQVPEDAPHIRAPSPTTLARLTAARDHRGRLIAPGAATPWPEQDEKWHTMDRHQVYRQQQKWELPAERGQYDEWEACRAEDCVVPRYYDVQDRWYEMPPVDDGTRAKRQPEQFDEFQPPKDPNALPELAPNAYAPYEDGSKWYKIPGRGHLESNEQWRMC